MQIEKLNIEKGNQDPLGLSDLPQIEPDFDGWGEVKAALEGGSALPTWQRPVTWLAAAASLVLVVSLTLQQTDNGVPVETDLMPVTQPELAEVSTIDTIDSIIDMSQTLEQQLRLMRENNVSLPADSAIYVAELQDLVAQVDRQLSYSPDSINLWGQRVNLLLDLAQIYQHQWEVDYGMMASL